MFARSARRIQRGLAQVFKIYHYAVMTEIYERRHGYSQPSRRESYVDQQRALLCQAPLKLYLYVHKICSNAEQYLWKDVLDVGGCDDDVGKMVSVGEKGIEIVRDACDGYRLFGMKWGKGMICGGGCSCSSGKGEAFACEGMKGGGECHTIGM